MLKNLGVRNEHDICYYARDISENFLHRGSDTTDKLKMTLRFLKKEAGLKNLANLNGGHMKNIISNFQEKLKEGMSLSSINGYISSINNIARYIGKDELRINAKEAGLTRKYDYIKNKENTLGASGSFKEYLKSQYNKTGDIKYMAAYHAVNLMRNCNLRLSESLGIKILNKPIGNKLNLNKNDQTKHGRSRTVELYNATQKTALKEAKYFLKNNGLKNLNTPGTMKKGQDFMQNVLKDFKAKTGEAFHFHGERQAWAHDKYSHLWREKGFNVECNGKMEIDKKEWLEKTATDTGLTAREVKSIDKEIRTVITKDLERLLAVSRELLEYSQTADFKKIKSDLDDNKNKMEELKTPLINILNKINGRPILEGYCKFIED